MFLLHDYFLFYSPELLAAAAARLCFHSAPRVMRYDLSEDEKNAIKQAEHDVIAIFEANICPKLPGEGPVATLYEEDLRMIAEDLAWRKSL